MKFTLSWLKEHLETDSSLDEIVVALTSLGLEVESVDNPADALAAFRIAEVISAERHPQADKLQILKINVGDAEPLQVVCGASNARAGMRGVLGMPGAYVPGLDVTLKETSIRGVESFGMMCSLRELSISDEHEGIIDLPADAPVGEIYARWAGLDDPVIDVAITPNRQDCMGVRGIARDLAAAGLGSLKTLNLPMIKSSQPCPVSIRIEDTEGCPAFFGRVVSGVSNGASPTWLATRLKAVGQRSISALVDITNYIMLDLGRPLHVYDLAKLQGGLVARKARAGERVLALNGKEYVLDESVTVIADDVAVHDIGGIMGGDHSGVTETTTDILIECAYFTPEVIAQTGRKLNITSDARQRFERGVDPAFLEDGLTIATAMVQELCGGQASEALHIGTPPNSSRGIAYDPALTQNLAGVEVAPRRQREILSALGFGIDASWSISTPSWRRDIDGPADIVEEVIRIVGLDAIVSEPLPRAEGVAKPTATDAQRLERALRRAGAANGLYEAVTWSFIPEEWAAIFGGGFWTLANPISEALKVMRPSLLPGLIMAAKRNVDRGEKSVRLFELGRSYLEDSEKTTLTVVLGGARQERDWRSGSAQAFDAFDAKAIAQSLLASAGLAVDKLQVMDAVSDVWHPGRSASLRLGPKNAIANFGEVHPAILAKLDVDFPVVAVEISLDAIPAKRSQSRTRPAHTPPGLQPVKRDFAFMVSDKLAAGDLLRAVKSSDKQNITDVAIFDRFSGKGVEEGELSIAVEVVLQPKDRSYTDEELKAISDKIIAAAAKAGARLRG